MERALRLLKNKKFSQIITDDEFARAAWPVAVGKAIAAHTSRVRLVRSTLVVEVQDAIWQKQLHTLSKQILERIQKLSGSDAIKDIEFRVGIPRREAQRAESLAAQSAERRGHAGAQDGGAQPDEADSIQDAVLQKIFRASRNKASA